MEFPNFNSSVNDNGYRWWYIDAVSDDGESALTVIVFVGSVFSPYYAWARKSAPTAAEAHCAINVALYGRTNRWTMTERAANSIERSKAKYQVGPSAMHLDNGTLVCDINEVAVPLPSRVVGQVSITLDKITTQPRTLDRTGQHHWQVLAPKARIRVAFQKPAVSWNGYAYVDTNYGATPMEEAFTSWNWSRAHLDNGDTVVQYDVVHRNAEAENSTLRFNQDGCTAVEDFNIHAALPKTRYWRIPRTTRTQTNAKVSKLTTLEDTPFYSRSSYGTVIDDHSAVCIHESIDFDRLNKQWVKCLLPFRMPRSSRTVKTKRDCSINSDKQ